MKSKPISVLIFEDMPESGETVAGLLNSDSVSDFNVTIAADEGSALRVCRSGAVECVILGHDTAMTPATSFASRIKKVNGRAPPAVVLVADQDEEESVYAALGCSIDDYVLKQHLNQTQVGRAVRSAARFANVQRELVKAATDLSQMASHDPLTGLANRGLFHDRLEHAVEAARRGRTTVCLVVLDLEGIKELNVEVGHKGGDAALKEVSERLLTVARKADTVARLGGDEFAIVLETGCTAEGAALVAERIIDEVAKPIQFGPQTFTLAVNIGISMFAGDSPDLAVYQADRAMDAARLRGGGYQIFGEAEAEMAPPKELV